MIIELQHFEPQDGRQYERSMGGEMAAIERIRIDCVECQYTKVKLPGDELDTTKLQQYGQAPQLLPSCSIKGRQWHEVILVQYRCANEEPRCLAGVGYILMLYGAEPRPTRLEALLGPPRKEEPGE